VRPFPILLLSLALAGCDDATETRSAEAPAAGQAKTETGRLDRSFAGTPAPRSIFEDPEGEAITLADFQGKPLLVNLWATWCPPCIAEMPTLDVLAGREKGLQVLVVSEDLNGHDKVDAFFAQRRFANLQPYIDPGLSLMTELKVDTLPTTILYDAQGREVWRMTGMADWQGARAAKLLAEAK
jgi:thiol-disulfide isomerase/thioredoxin